MGLLGRVVRTGAKAAVVSGTASVVHGRVSRRQAEKFADRDAEIAATRGAGAATGAQAAYAPPQAAAGGADATIAQLKQLDELRDQGILTDQEFEAQKAKVLGS